MHCFGILRTHNLGGAIRLKLIIVARFILDNDSLALLFFISWMDSMSATFHGLQMRLTIGSSCWSQRDWLSDQVVKWIDDLRRRHHPHLRHYSTEAWVTVQVPSLHLVRSLMMTISLRPRHCCSHLSLRSPWGTRIREFVFLLYYCMKNNCLLHCKILVNYRALLACYDTFLCLC